MTDSYFFTQMVNIMCAPLYVYDTEAHLDEKIGGGEEAWWVKLGYDSDTASGILTEKKVKKNFGSFMMNWLKRVIWMDWLICL